MMHREIIWSVASAQRLHPCKFLFLRKAFGHLCSNEISGTSGWGGRRRGRLVGSGLKLHFMPLSPCKPQKKKKKSEHANIVLHCLVVSITFSSEEISLDKQGENSYCSSKVSLWRTAVGGLRSKPGAPVARAVGKELLGNGELALGLKGVFC